MAQINSTTFLTDTIKFIRDRLIANITDPITTRAGNSKFVMTSYPGRETIYPIITVRHEGPPEFRKLGMRSELQWVTIPLEIRIWAKGETQKEQLMEKILNFLRTNQYGSTNTSADDKQLHDYELLSSTPVDEDGINGIKSQVMKISYKFILGS